MLLRAEMSKPLLQAQIATFDRFFWRISVPAWFPTRGCSFTPIQAPLPAELPTCRRRPFFIQVSSTAPSAVAAFGARSTPDFDRRWTCMPAGARRCPPAELAPTISRAFASDSQRQPERVILGEDAIIDCRREWFWERMQ